MPTVIKLKRGTTTPTTSNIVSGEIAVDTSAQKIYINDGGTIKEIGSGSVSVSDISDLTATAAELNILDGVTATTAELNYTDGVTSNIQTQLNAKAPTAGPTFTGIATSSGGLAAQGTSLPASGAGVEINFGLVSGEGTVQAFDRDGSAWEQLRLRGNQVAFDISGTEKVRIDSSGDVGIGESGPSARLHVKGAGTAPQLIVEETGANSSFMRIISDSGNAGLQFRRGGLSGTDTWTIYDSGGTLYVDDDSGSVFNVTPTALNIANAAGPALLNEAATSTNPTLVPNRANPGDGIGAAAAGNLHLITNGGNRVAIGGSGVVNILTAGSFGTPALSFNSDFDTGIYHSAADTLAFATGGGGRLTINTSTVTSGLTIDVTTASGPAMLNEAATSTNPTLVPSKADPDTGMGWVSADIGALVAGGAKALEWNSSSNVGIGASASTPRLNIQSAALGSALQLSDGTNYGLNFNGVSGGVELVMNGTQTMVLGNVTNGDLLEINTTTGSTGGTGSAGAGNQYVELKINGNRYKLLHDGTI